MRCSWASRRANKDVVGREHLAVRSIRGIKPRETWSVGVKSKRANVRLTKSEETTRDSEAISVGNRHAQPCHRRRGLTSSTLGA